MRTVAFALALGWHIENNINMQVQYRQACFKLLFWVLGNHKIVIPIGNPTSILFKAYFL